MALGEYFGALEVVIADLEHMNQGLMEGRGGTREQGVAELVSGGSVFNLEYTDLPVIHC
jgi:hypothetical protein